MTSRLLAALAVLVLLAVVLSYTDFYGEPEWLLDGAVFVAVTAVLAGRLWLHGRARR